ncbi:MAG: hypothetical protein IJW88_01865 [Alistipes sp.]|nr:hypothetical protein [Alistipes sp.]
MAQTVGQTVVQGAQQVGQVGQVAQVVVQQPVQPVQQSVQQSAQPQAKVVDEPRQVVTPPQSKGKAKGGIDLGSLDRVISSLNKDKPRSTQAASEDGTVKIDPQSESKLLASLQDFIDAVLKMHPRFHAAFNNVTVAGNTITLEAPTVALERDLNESHTEICEIAASVAGIDGRLELNVVLNEVEIKLLPVKIEDRYQFIEDLNPRGIKYFIDKFDLTL